MWQCLHAARRLLQLLCPLTHEFYASKTTSVLQTGSMCWTVESLPPTTDTSSGLAEFPFRLALQQRGESAVGRSAAGFLKFRPFLVTRSLFTAARRRPSSENTCRTGGRSRSCASDTASGRASSILAEAALQQATQACTRPHEHWHCDISCPSMCDTFYCACSVRDGFSSRYFPLRGSNV